MSSSSFSIAAPSAIASLRASYPMAITSTQLLRFSFASKTHVLRLCFANSGHDTSKQESTEFGSSSVEKQGSGRKEGRFLAFSSKEILTRLKRYGVSGILSYGLLNTVYYLTTFLVVWFYVAPAPGRMGYLASVERFLKVMAMVWAGSQVTKLIRAGGALALAPFVDTGLSWFTVKFGLKSQGKAFMVIAGLCFGLTFLMDRANLTKVSDLMVVGDGARDKELARSRTKVINKKSSDSEEQFFQKVGQYCQCIELFKEPTGDVLSSKERGRRSQTFECKTLVWRLQGRSTA
ncbi:Unknown protein [Striga hermonthica]|uniref:Uncharacterized protein n=1 Tax=Striga hermonthica TaxID=68872 RepID=A0A9N7RL07_STRHE|nr:Unknown protein [Striga hermonthica]